MLYRFPNKNERGVCRVKNIQLVWYDMLNGEGGFDENFSELSPEQERLLAFVETEEDEGNRDRSRVFVNMDDGDCYELIMRKVNSKNCNTFHGK